jgi:hypothetical protein
LDSWSPLRFQAYHHRRKGGREKGPRCTNAEKVSKNWKFEVLETGITRTANWREWKLSAA